MATGTGVISTAAGNGTGGRSGDGGAATSAQLFFPSGVAADSEGNVFIAESDSHRIRRVASGTGGIVTVAGQLDPEGMGPTAQAALATPEAVALGDGMALFAGGASGTAQALRDGDGLLEVVAGRYPQPVATADFARFRTASFGDVDGIAYDAAAGRIYLTETTAHRLWTIDPVDLADETTWTIALLAGDATEPAGPGAFADGPALAARFDSPAGLYFDDVARVLYVADAGNHVIRAMPIALDGTAGLVTTIAGTPRTLGYFGDGGAAGDALLYGPTAVTRCAASGDLYIADTTNHRVRRVEAGTGVITSVLGDGVPGSAGQGAPAATFPVDAPRGIACDAAGNVFVTSRTTVRLLPATIALDAATGVVDGTGLALTIFGAPPRTDYPASVSSCLTAVTVVDDVTTWATDSCLGTLVELWRQPAP
ncbi:MAG: hypothetical protein R2939_22420 [Kofleriaceae bacterium]